MGYGPQRGHLTTRKFIRINPDVCVGCGICVRFCTVGTVLEISPKTGKAHMKNPRDCGGCFMCMTRCPNGAIEPIVVEHKGTIDYTIRKPIAPGQKEAGSDNA